MRASIASPARPASRRASPRLFHAKASRLRSPMGWSRSRARVRAFGRSGVVDDPAVVRVGDSQRAVEELVRLLQAELVHGDESRAQLGQPIAGRDQDVVPGVARQEGPHLIGRGGVVGQDQHRAALIGSGRQRRAVEHHPLICRSRDVFRRRAQGAQQGLEGPVGGDGLLVVAVQVDEEDSAGEPAPLAGQVRGLDGERGLADAAEAGHGGDEGRQGLGRLRPGRVQGAQQVRSLALPAGESPGPRRQTGHRLGDGDPTLLDHDLYADHLAQKDSAPKVGVVAVVPGRLASWRIPLHGPRDGTGHAPRIGGEQVGHRLAPLPYGVPPCRILRRLGDVPSGCPGVQPHSSRQRLHRPASAVPTRALGQGRQQRRFHPPVPYPVLTPVGQRTTYVKGTASEGSSCRLCVPHDLRGKPRHGERFQHRQRDHQPATIPVRPEHDQGGQRHGAERCQVDDDLDSLP